MSSIEKYVAMINIDINTMSLLLKKLWANILGEIIKNKQPNIDRRTELNLFRSNK